MLVGHNASDANLCNLAGATTAADAWIGVEGRAQERALCEEDCILLSMNHKGPFASVLVEDSWIIQNALRQPVVAKADDSLV